MEHHACLRLLLASALIASLAWQPAESITVTSRGEPPTPISSQNFTMALRLLERMFLSQERQRRLIPYYSYYVGNNRNAYSRAPAAYSHQSQNNFLARPTPFPVQNTALDLLAKSLFAPHQIRGGYSNIQGYRPNYAPLQRPAYANVLPYLARPTQPSPLTEPPVPTSEDHLTAAKQYVDLLRYQARPTTETPLVPETLAPSLPRLLGPLASVTRFPGPAPKKAGKDAPGRAGVDYPTYHKIPPTEFSCATQRYKGFFADPATSCQVWHYCDLNGGQASFLCPNGTIFSQVLLTCDWWFNVKCTNTLQAYVLNERLYKYIMPKQPSFPEDFTGPQVDAYLTKNQPELRQKEQAKAERLKKKYKPFEFEDVDELQALLDKMRNRKFEEEEEELAALKLDQEQAEGEQELENERLEREEMYVQ